MNTVLLLLLHLLPFLQSAPEPDTHLHVYLPPEGEKGGSPNTGGGFADYGLNASGLQSRHYDYMGGGFSPRQLGQIAGQDYAGKTRDRNSEGKGWIDASLQWDQYNQWQCGASPVRMNKDEIIGGRLAEAHAFPWMVRVKGGCARTLCGGALITSKHVLTSFGCTLNIKESRTKPCDHSDGKRMIIMGQNSLKDDDLEDAQKMPIIDVKYPKNAGFGWSTEDEEDHDFAMYILKDPVAFSQTISPICLPPAGANHYGKKAVAAGWGRYAVDNTQDSWTGDQSDLLKRVNLMVSETGFKHNKMLGTKLEFKRGEWQDPCSGDAGGPLMYQTGGRWVIIGTVYGGGFDCKTGKISKLEGYAQGIWNKVSAHTNWILQTLNQDQDVPGQKKNTVGDDYQPSVAGGPRIPREPPSPFLPSSVQPTQNQTNSDGADYSTIIKPESRAESEQPCQEPAQRTRCVKSRFRSAKLPLGEPEISDYAYQGLAEAQPVYEDLPERGRCSSRRFKRRLNWWVYECKACGYDFFKCGQFCKGSTDCKNCGVNCPF